MISDEGAPHLQAAISKNKNLKSLDIGNNYITGEGLKVILESF